MKKRNAFIIAALTVMTLALSACGGQTDASTDNPNSSNDISSTEQVVESEVEETTQDEVAQEETKVEEPVQEVESTEVEEVANTPEAWFESLGLTEPTVAIWDVETCTGIIVENGQEYEFGDNNKLLLYYAVPFTELYSTEGMSIGERFSTYMEIEVSFKKIIDGMLEEVLGETTYRQEFILIKKQ